MIILSEHLSGPLGHFHLENQRVWVGTIQRIGQPNHLSPVNTPG